MRPELYIYSLMSKNELKLIKNVQKGQKVNIFVLQKIGFSETTNFQQNINKTYPRVTL